MGKLDGQDDGLLQRLLGHLEPRDVIPAEHSACPQGSRS
jgi:hypothetical protein